MKLFVFMKMHPNRCILLDHISAVPDDPDKLSPRAAHCSEHSSSCSRIFLHRNKVSSSCSTRPACNRLKKIASKVILHHPGSFTGFNSHLGKVLCCSLCSHCVFRRGSRSALAAASHFCFWFLIRLRKFLSRDSSCSIDPSHNQLRL